MTAPRTQRALNPDHFTIGENLRAAFQNRVEGAVPGARPEWKDIARAVPIDPTALSRAVAGRVGLSESKIIRLAELLNVEAGKLLAGVSEQGMAKYPNIPTGYHNKARQLSGMSVTNVASLIRNTPQSDALLSHLFGGLHPDLLPKFRGILAKLYTTAADKRAAAIAAGHYDPATGKFKS